jgi:bacillithiol biosynthesis deacetylase BshB1
LTGTGLDVLAVGAHPDDAEIGCGGTLLLAVEAGARVGVADLTLGEAATLGTPEQRDAERARAAELLGLSARPCLGLPDTAVGTAPDHRDAVVRLIRETRPRIVLAPPLNDRHPDHAASGRLVRDACFLAGLPAAGAGQAHRPDRVYHYLLHDPLDVSFVVDVSSVWERKLQAIHAYGSQFGAVALDGAVIDVPRFLELIDARASVLGAMIGAQRGEGFWARGPLGLRDLPGLDAVDAPHARTYRLFS